MQSRFKLMKHGVRTNGKVINYIAKENEDGQMLYHPVIEFYEVSGKKRIIESESGSSERLRYGKDIVIYYDKDDSGKLVKGSSDLIFEFIILFFGVAGCTIIITYLLLWW